MKSLLITLGAILLSSTASIASTLTIKVTNVKSSKGTIQVALWDTSSGFPDDYNTAYLTKTVNASQKIVSFKNLDAGNYAVALYHDKNNDEKLNTNFLGIPKEGFGFSNNPLILTGPPSFNKAKITLKKSIDKTQVIKLKHF